MQGRSLADGQTDLSLKRGDRHLNRARQKRADRTPGLRSLVVGETVRQRCDRNYP